MENNLTANQQKVLLFMYSDLKMGNITAQDFGEKYWPGKEINKSLVRDSIRVLTPLVKYKLIKKGTRKGISVYKLSFEGMQYIKTKI